AREERREGAPDRREEGRVLVAVHEIEAETEADEGLDLRRRLVAQSGERRRAREHAREERGIARREPPARVDEPEGVGERALLDEHEVDARRDPGLAERRGFVEVRVAVA